MPCACQGRPVLTRRQRRSLWAGMLACAAPMQCRKLNIKHDALFHDATERIRRSILPFATVLRHCRRRRCSAPILGSVPLIPFVSTPVFGCGRPSPFISFCLPGLVPPLLLCPRCLISSVFCFLHSGPLLQSFCFLPAVEMLHFHYETIIRKLAWVEMSPILRTRYAAGGNRHVAVRFGACCCLCDIVTGSACLPGRFWQSLLLAEMPSSFTNPCQPTKGSPLPSCLTA